MSLTQSCLESVPLMQGVRQTLAELSEPYIHTFEPMVRPMYEPEAQYVLVGVIVGALIVMILALQWLNHRRRMAEMRYKALETLSRQGSLTGQQVEEFLSPTRARTRRWLLLGWFGLILGILLMIIGLNQHGRDAEEMALAGFCVAFCSTAILATPLMLREFKKQGVI